LDCKVINTSLHNDQAPTKKGGRKSTKGDKTKKNNTKTKKTKTNPQINQQTHQKPIRQKK
jgi:hypothetical protein